MIGLKKDLDQLKYMIEFPNAYLFEYFFEVKTEVDRIFIQLELNKRIASDKSDSVIACNDDESKNAYLSMIAKLDELYDTLKKRFLNKKLTNDHDNMIRLIESQLVNKNIELDVLNELKSSLHNEIKETKKTLFSNQSVFFIDKGKLGYRRQTNLKNKFVLVIVKNEYIEENSIYMEKYFNYTGIDKEINSKEFTKFIKINNLLEEIYSKDIPIMEINIDLKTVKNLYLQTIELGSIQENLFSELINLEILDLSSCSLTQIDSKALNGLGKLKNLNLSFNQIETFHFNLLFGLTSLEHLNLSNNLTESFDFKILSGLVNLKKLNLTDCNIESIKFDSFKDCKLLEEVYLSNNSINSIDNTAFNGLTRLRLLYLGYNQIEELSNQTFNGLENLTSLTLKHNKIQSFHHELFKDLKSLSQLDLAINPVIEFDFDTLNTLKSLIKLNLEKMNITLIKAKSLEHMNNLEILNLGYNQIKSIDQDAFMGLSKLKELNLEHNLNLDLKNGYCFRELENLTKLKLNNCKIESFDMDSLNGLVNLELVDFNSNPVFSDAISREIILKQSRDRKFKIISFSQCIIKNTD